MGLDEDCRLCVPPEQDYSTVQQGGQGPGQLGVSYQKAYLKSVTFEEFHKYLRKGDLPKDVCGDHMKDHLESRLRTVYGTITKFSINMLSKRVTLCREVGKDVAVLSFSDLADLL